MSELNMTGPVTMKYRAIITSKFRTKNLLNFYNSIGDNANNNTVYITFGRDEPWSEHEKDPEFAPPYPIDDASGVTDTWTHMLGALKVSKELVDAVIPRRDWGDVRYPNPRVFTIGEIVVVNNAPYNRTDSGEGWMVYRVVDVPEQGVCSIVSNNLDSKEKCTQLGGVWTPSYESTSPPKGKGDGNESGFIDMEDGYVWEYLYSIPADASINRCTNEYIVVPTPEEIKVDPSRWGYQHNLTWEHKSYDLVYRVKVNTLRFRAYMDSLFFPEASWPGNNGFRQLSLILNPFEAKSHPSDKDVKATKSYYHPEDLDKHSGEMMYMDNRQPIIRSMDQTEEINIIFSF